MTIFFSSSLRTSPQLAHPAPLLKKAVRIGLAIAITTGSLIGLAQPSMALSEDELFELCSDYPYNGQCEGYEVPVPLSRRAGEEGVCALNMADIAVTELCKVSNTEETITVYVEEGEPIALMDDERRTAEFSIDLTNVSSLGYREDEQVNRDRLTRNILLFGLLGAAFTEPDEVSQLEIEFADTTSAANSNAETIAVSDTEATEEIATEEIATETADVSEAEATEEIDAETIEVSDTEATEEIEAEAADVSDAEATEGADAETADVNDAETAESSNADSSGGRLVFESDRQKGTEMRETLEQLTGLTAEISL